MENVEDIYPLTSMQELMLLRLLTNDGGGALEEPVRTTFRGDLDADQFQAAWQDVIDRHPILRTAFLTEGLKQPMQVVRQEARPEWQVEDWRGRSDPEQELAAFVEREARRSFDPTQAPLLRFALLQVADDRFHFMQTAHHLLLDRWSAMQVFSEAMELYEARRSGRAASLPDVRPYRDYVGWLQAQDDADAEAYWRDLLASFSGPTPLPYASDTVNTAGARAELRTRSLDAEATEALRAAARRMRVTLSTVLRGAWGLVLGAVSRECDVVFGVTVSGRPADLEGVEEIVGLFINNLPVRVKPDDRAEVGAWLRELQTADVRGRRFEHTPLAYVEDWAGVGRSGPLFESLMVFQNDPVRGTPDGSPPASLEIVEGGGVLRTAYPLTLGVFPGGDLTLQFTYDAAAFEERTIDALLDGLVSVLAAIAATAGPEERCVADLGAALSGLEAVAVHPAAVRTVTAPIVLAADEFVAPGTPTEVAVAKVWSDVLEVERVGLHDNFFDLGGTSLLAIRAIARLQKDAGIQPGAASFVTQSLGQLAAALDTGGGAGGEARGGSFFRKLLPKWGRKG